MSSLYDYLKNDKDNPIARIPRALIKRLNLDFQYRQDATQECYVAWMAAEYDPLFDNDGIISYAYNCARMALLEWRRHTLLPVTITRSQRPEPYALGLQELHGDTMQRFLLATERLRKDPLDVLLGLEAVDDEEDTGPTIADIRLPADPAGKKRFDTIVKMLAEGETADAIAGVVGVNKRTVYRRLKVIKEYNLPAIAKMAE